MVIILRELCYIIFIYYYYHFFFFFFFAKLKRLGPSDDEKHKNKWGWPNQTMEQYRFLTVSLLERCKEYLVSYVRQ